MPSDPSAFFLVLVVSLLVDSLLLLWCWLQNRADRTLLWCSASYAFAATGNLLLMGRGALAGALSIDLAVTMILVSHCLAWIAALTFNGRRVRLEVCFAGPALWLLACRVPEFHQSYDARVILISLIAASYCLLTAKEFWGQDGPRSRYPIAVAMILHSMMVVARIPLAMAEMNQRTVVAFKSPSFDLMVLEALVFAQCVAFLFVSLTKERVEARLRAAALTDPLTGLSNRRALFEHGKILIAQSARRRRPISVTVFDLDAFKQINDTFGHPIGDAVIRTFSTAAQAALRTGDLIGRVGGEEFVAILPDTDKEQGYFLTRRLMTTFAILAADVEGCRTEATASAGIMTCEDGAQTLEEMLAIADRALYEGKRRGRDSLRVAAPVPITAQAAPQPALLLSTLHRSQGERDSQIQRLCKEPPRASLRRSAI